LTWGAGPNSPNTNIANLTDARLSSLAPYTAQSPAVYWCPTDRYLSPSQKAAGFDHRIRSVAMDAAVGGGALSSSQPGYKPAASLGFGNFFVATKMNEIVAPGTSQSWVFLDEHPDSIDDGILYINPAETSGTGSFTELPASDHNGACGIGFADGHGEIHKWLDRQTVRPITYGVVQRVYVSNDADLAYLASHTPVAR
jgi:prepilin-type processing-associated H-X9-DG protein